MIINLSRVTTVAFASLLFAGVAVAQTTPPAASSTTAPAASKATAPMKKMAKPRTSQSIECSKEADAKGLHGKERKKFRSECKKQAAQKPKS